jgi:hypothetical protein
VGRRAVFCQVRKHSEPMIRSVRTIGLSAECA